VTYYSDRWPTASKGIQLDDGSFDAGGCGLNKGSDESER
jgi:hypothetical protein